MKARLERLRRLHDLRGSLADAALAERKRAAQDALQAERAMIYAREVSSNALAYGGDSWTARRGGWELARLQGEHLATRRTLLAERERIATVAEHEAVRQREQMRRLCETTEALHSREASRREQARLDDLFAMGRVRAAMATAF